MLLHRYTLVLYFALTSQPTQTAHSTFCLPNVAPLCGLTSFSKVLSAERSWFKKHCCMLLWRFFHAYISMAWSEVSFWKSPLPAVTGCYGNKKLSAGNLGSQNVVIEVYKDSSSAGAELMERQQESQPPSQTKRWMDQVLYELMFSYRELWNNHLHLWENKAHWNPWLCLHHFFDHLTCATV